MLISYRLKFIFVHVYRTGGTSITHALGAYSALPYESFAAKGLQKLGFLPSLGSFPPHVKAIELRRRLGRRIFDPFFKFAFVRNPWDREVSNYFFILGSPDHPFHSEVKHKGSFERYLEWRARKGGAAQKALVTDPRGRLLVDFVGRFESLGEDFKKACSHIGVEAELPCLNRADHRPYRECYNASTRRLVSEMFKDDIDFFGYDF
ncbi:MAG: sulfotransferase family 2 domain-containing protein [Candidatus Omnitrophica bacterium]|nr:sulfotransferase family 2 domain-containing protein [Candidatus Omnitrophota bacterium]